MFDPPFDQMTTGSAAGALVVIAYMTFSMIAKRDEVRQASNRPQECSCEQRLTRLEANADVQFPRLHRDMGELKEGLIAVHGRLDDLYKHLVDTKKR